MPMLFTWGRRALTAVLAIAVSLALAVPSALAAIQVPLTDVTYHDCPPELAAGAVTSGGQSRPANCFLITGIAVNASSTKTIYDADIYGRILDADGEPVIQNRTRLGLIEELPPGKHPFELRVSVPANQPTPLQLKQFKASGFSSPSRTAFLKKD